MATTTATKVTFQSYLLADVLVFVTGLELKIKAHRLAAEARQMRAAAGLVSQLSDAMLSGAFQHTES